MSVLNQEFNLIVNEVRNEMENEEMNPGEFKKDPIYTITTIRYSGNYDSRCVGFFHEKEWAIQAVKENLGDINEDGYYRYCVIEEVRPSIYQYDDNAMWFTWNNSKHEYEQCEKPEKFRNTCGWGIG